MKAGGIFGSALGEPMEPVIQGDAGSKTAEETGWASALFDAGLDILNAKRSAPDQGPVFEAQAGSCTDPAVIASVQAFLGVGADGKWGPKSQAALDALGKNFKDIAPNCTGNVPKYGGTSGGTLPTTGGGTSIVTPTPQNPLSGMTSSPVFWAILLAAGVGGYLYMTSNPTPKKGKGSKGTRR